jgi:DNA-binding beta-propeller fold protein YncE
VALCAEAPRWRISINPGRSAEDLALSPTLSRCSPVVALVLCCAPIALAAGGRPSAYVRLVQSLGAEDSALPALGGAPFPPGSGAILVPGEGGAGTLLVFPPTEDRPGFSSLRLPRPVNTAFDAASGRLLVLSDGELAELRPGADRRPDPRRRSRSDAGPLGIRAARGLTLDPASGRLFVLDASGPRIARIDPHPVRGLDPATAAREGRLSWIDLRASGLGDLEGLAFDPATGRLHVLSPGDGRLYELDPNGVVVASRDLSGAGLGKPAGMGFAPSADQTDDPARTSLYVATSAASIVELSFTEPLALPAAATVGSALVRVIDLSRFDPPSPDSAGITWLEDEGTLWVSDSEVNEMPIFTGDNLFEVGMNGSLVATHTTIDFSDEPTGLSYDPGDATLYVSDDTGTRRIYIVGLGPDRRYGTNDDSLGSFGTGVFASNDPEGVAFADGDLFIADGVNAEVYRVRPGPNGVFDGVPPAGDDGVSQFDTEALGVLDPEGIAFNTDSGNLYVVGNPSNRVAEITRGGSLVQMLDISAANARKPAGLAYAPSSATSGAMNLYIVQRGVDNDTDPNENDGKIFEMTLPAAACSGHADCDDGLYCNGAETCVGGSCQPGADACPGEECDEGSQTCAPTTCNANGVCNEGETCLTCPSDCTGGPAGCGNGVCEPALGEDCLSCPGDCNGKQAGRQDQRFCCGDGAGANPVGCGDLICHSAGHSCSDAPIGAWCCGDGLCGGLEDTASCSLDCGEPPACGDTFCDAGNGESSCACAADCGSPPGSEVACADGLDDDCDGLVDAADPDCCNLAQVGDACSQDTECCSNRCRGKSGAKVCK